MFGPIIKFAAKSYLTITAVIFLTVFMIFVLFYGLIQFVQLVAG